MTRNVATGTIQYHSRVLQLKKYGAGAGADERNAPISLGPNPGAQSTGSSGPGTGSSLAASLVFALGAASYGADSSSLSGILYDDSGSPRSG